MDEEGKIIPNGATVVRNVLESFDESEVIYSGISVKNTNGSNDYIKMIYEIERIDNGIYQICFPSTCNMQDEVGAYETAVGQLMGEMQDIQSEWFPTANGTCVVTMTIEIFTKQGLFPPSYVHKAYGPSVTVQFVKSSSATDDGSPYVKLADGVYLDGTTLYICNGVTSLGGLQINPSEIYCYAAIPPSCLANTFTGYDATLHVPAASMVSYFTALYWYNFNNILSDAIEPLSVTMNTTDAEVEIGQQMSLSATVAPSDATPKTVYWSSTDPSVATVSNGGTVTAVAAGECDILATCVDKVAVCHVAVVPPRVTITLDKHEARLLPNHTMTLIATCSPINVDIAVTSSNPAVAIPRLVNGTIMVVGVAKGTATITVNAADGWSIPDSCEVTVYTDLGDVNGDGYVNISDVTSLINYLLSGNTESLEVDNADTNKDSKVSISDVTTLISYLLGGIDINPPAQEIFEVNGTSFIMVDVEGGTFIMGATSEQGDEGWSHEYPTHNVSLSSFKIGQTEVTQTLWEAVMGNNPSHYQADLNQPVENVSWEECMIFISKLNEITGRNFRMPTDSEWEYAARGGKRSKGYKYSGGNDIDKVAWYKNNGGATTHIVATKIPNELGIYDMSGNVYEMCQDFWGSYADNPQTDPIGAGFYYTRVRRSGSFNMDARYCRVSCRDEFQVHNVGSNTLGLRLALDDENSSKLMLAKSVAVFDVAEQFTIDILNGKGNYTLKIHNDGIVSGVVSGEKIILTGKTIGFTTVILEDNISHLSTTLNVVVTLEKPKIFNVRGVTFTMMPVAAGTFMMGATPEQLAYASNDEKPAHKVTLTKNYYLGQTEVTRALWEVVMEDNPNLSSDELNKPVTHISWDDCQVFISKLNEITGMTFRLPTEAEWEFAARGGNKSMGYIYSGSNNPYEVAWFWESIPSQNLDDERSQPVAQKAPNELGLYDMSGNVPELVYDFNYNYTSGDQIDPVCTYGQYHITRGGSWASGHELCRVSDRDSYYYYDGLRLAL